MGSKHSLGDESDQDEEKDNETITLGNLDKYDRKLIGGFMRGFGKTLILWHISKKRQHGYEIMAGFQKITGNKNMPGPSMVYPILHQLEERGLIKGSWEAQGKRKVKYYEITDKGKKTLSRIQKVIKTIIIKFWEDFWDDIFSNDPKKEGEV